MLAGCLDRERGWTRGSCHNAPLELHSFAVEKRKVPAWSPATWNENETHTMNNCGSLQSQEHVSNVTRFFPFSVVRASELFDANACRLTAR